MNEEVAALFHQLADLSTAERAVYFDEHPVEDAIRREVEALLAYDGGPAGRELDQDIGKVAAAALQAAEWREHERAAYQGKRCGPFRLLDLIGRGGMGVVYLAERADGEVRQRAAVKLPRTGPYDAVSRERFLQERQILASLAHPHIARLLDAGHLEDGQPYLAMEYVDGMPLDRYLAAAGAALTVRRKIGLILKVAGAVSYLHRNLVVHRDLKPGNILVTSDGGEPKLVDFGIAKILDLAGTGATLTGQAMLTPDFASPEQLRGEPISTATDIYSLGAVLYDLLTGQAPRHAGAAGSGSRSETARASRLAPAAVDADLDAILHMALREEPRERYATADQFAEDLEAYLDSRPVRARRGEWSYRLRKAARRYWIPATAGALTLAGLAGGLTVANRERRLAEQRFEDVRRLANRLFDIDEQVRQLPNAAGPRQLIVDTSLEYLTRLRASAAQNPDLALDLGTAYLRVARVQGIPLRANLGQSKNAAENLALAGQLVESVLAARPAHRLAMLRRAQIAHDQMSLAESDPGGQPLPKAREAEVWLQRYLAGGAQVDKTEADEVVSIGLNVANQYQIREENRDAVRLLRQIRQVAEANGRKPQLAGLRIAMTRVLRRMGDFDGALATIREQTRDAGGSLLPQPPLDRTSGDVLRRYRLALATEGDVLCAWNEPSLGRPSEALAPVEQAFRTGLAMTQKDPNNALYRLSVSNDGRRLAAALLGSNPRRALEVLDESVRQASLVKNTQRAEFEQLLAHVQAAATWLAMGRTSEARRRIDRATELVTDLKLFPAGGKTEPGSEASQTIRVRAEVEAAEGNLERAVRSYTELVDAMSRSGPRPEERLGEAFHLSATWIGLERLYRRSAAARGLADEIETRRLALWRHWERKLPGNAMVRRHLEEVVNRLGRDR